MREFDPSACKGAEVPGPYFGGPAEFTQVAEMMKRAAPGILKSLGA